MDIKDCNKVIRFDKVHNVIDNIQARGRIRNEDARADSSSYTVMVLTAPKSSVSDPYDHLYDQEESVYDKIQEGVLGGIQVNRKRRSDVAEMIPFSKVSFVLNYKKASRIIRKSAESQEVEREGTPPDGLYNGQPMLLHLSDFMASLLSSFVGADIRSTSSFKHGRDHIPPCSLLVSKQQRREGIERRNHWARTE